MKRILTAMFAVPILLAVIIATPRLIFATVVIATALVGYWEFSSLRAITNIRLLHVGYLTTSLLVVSFYTDKFSFLTASLLSILIITINAMFSDTPSEKRAVSLMGTMFATFYLGALLGTIVGLRGLGPDTSGRFTVIFLLAIVMIGDAAAFYIGSAFGKTALAPRLSPKKTFEGLVGGVLFSIVTAWCLQSIWLPNLPPLYACFLGLTLSLLGALGDLFESFLKRCSNVKDTSSLIPGHGGILDRIDSLLFASPACFLGMMWLN